MGIRVQNGIESVTVQINYKDKRRKDRFTVEAPRVDYSIDYNVLRIDSWQGGPGYVHSGLPTIKLSIEGPVPKKSRR